LLDVRNRLDGSDLTSLSKEQLLGKYSWEVQLSRFTTPSDRARLHVMPCASLATDQSRRVADLDLNGLYKADLGRPLMRLVSSELVSSGLFDFVFLDTAADTSGESLRMAADFCGHVVFVSGLNQQSIEGTSHLVARVREQPECESAVNSPTMQLVFSLVSVGEDETFKARFEAAREAIEGSETGSIPSPSFFHYHPQLSLVEDPRAFFAPSSPLAAACHLILSSMLGIMGITEESDARAAIRGMVDGDARRAEFFLRRLAHLHEAPIAVSYAIRDLADGNLEGAGVTPAEGDLALRHLSEDPAFADVRTFLARFLAPDDVPDLLKSLRDSSSSGLHLGGFALELARAAARRDPLSSTHVSNHALALHLYSTDIEAAESLYMKAIELDPKDSIAISNYANLLRQVGRAEDAEVLFRRARELNPGSISACRNYALFLMDQNRLQDAATLLEGALSNLSGDNDLSALYANVLTRLRVDLDKAEMLYRQSFGAPLSSYLNTLSYATFLWTQRGNEKAAEVLYSIAINQGPHDPRCFRAYASFKALAMGDARASEELFQAADALGPPDHGHAPLRARVLVALGDVPRALEHVREAAVREHFAPKPLSSIPEGDYWLVLYCLGTGEEQATALPRLKALAQHQQRVISAIGRDELIKAATDQGHPEASGWLPKLVQVLLAEAEPSTLADWQAWQDA
jgi:tetratricopeptide (TPR) repeat protein